MQTWYGERHIGPTFLRMHVPRFFWLLRRPFNSSNLTSKVMYVSLNKNGALQRFKKIGGGPS